MATPVKKQKKDKKRKVLEKWLEEKNMQLSSEKCTHKHLVQLVLFNL